MSDLISRQALQEWIKDKTFGDIVVASEHNFDCLPSVEPERNVGKWINVDGSTNTADCSCCGNRGRAWMNYCYECGSTMKGGVICNAED